MQFFHNTPLTADGTTTERERGKYLALFRDDIAFLRDELSEEDRHAIVDGSG